MHQTLGHPHRTPTLPHPLLMLPPDYQRDDPPAHWPPGLPNISPSFRAAAAPPCPHLTSHLRCHNPGPLSVATDLFRLSVKGGERGGEKRLQPGSWLLPALPPCPQPVRPGPEPSALRGARAAAGRSKQGPGGANLGVTFDLTTSLRPRASSHTPHTAAGEAGLWLPRLVCQVGLFVFSGCDFSSLIPNARNLRAESGFAMRLQVQFPRGSQALSAPLRFTTKCEHIAYGGSPHSLGCAGHGT